MRCLLAVCMVGLMALPAAATVLVDGIKDAVYGSALAVQTVQTQFGDEGVDGDDVGGELDAAYARIENGALYLMLTGNAQNNFNKMEVFFDSKSGGENVLSGTPDYDFDTGGPYWTSTNLGGMKFDTGFEADYHLFARHGGSFEVDFIDRQGGTVAQVPGASGSAVTGGGAGAQTAVGSISAGSLASNSVVSSLSQNLLFGFDNSNNAGVAGGTGAANAAAAAAVTTGFEFCISLADLGSPAFGDTIKIAAMYDGSNHDYLSNQTLGGLPAGTGNLGGDGAGNFTGTLSGIDFNNFSGNQYFTITVVPEPSSLMLAMLAVLGTGFVTRRRK